MVLTIVLQARVLTFERSTTAGLPAQEYLLLDTVLLAFMAGEVTFAIFSSIRPAAKAYYRIRSR